MPKGWTEVHVAGMRGPAWTLSLMSLSFVADTPGTSECALLVGRARQPLGSPLPWGRGGKLEHGVEEQVLSDARRASICLCISLAVPGLRLCPQH